MWTYNFGPQKLMQRIWFEDGRVKLVESLRTRALTKTPPEGGADIASRALRSSASKSRPYFWQYWSHAAQASVSLLMAHRLPSTRQATGLLIGSVFGNDLRSRGVLVESLASYLAVSYPLETADPQMPASAPLMQPMPKVQREWPPFPFHQPMRGQFGSGGSDGQSRAGGVRVGGIAARDLSTLAVIAPRFARLSSPAPSRS